jgi:hypothetical protein
MFFLVDLSQRDIRVWTPAGLELLPFVDLERNFPTTLYKIFEKFPDIKDILVIHGPWSFTTLRIGCLCLNLMQLRRKKELRFYVRTKKDIFQYAFQQGSLPQFGLMRIGQQKNARELDLEQESREKVNIESKVESIKLKANNMQTYFFDESVCREDTRTQKQETRIAVAWEVKLLYADKELSLQSFFVWQDAIQFVTPEYLVALD